jgi:hypothetical protein
VTQGGRATYSITLQSQNGFSGTVNLTVLNLPGGQVLPGTGFTPQSVTLSANGQASSTLAVVTNGSTPTGTANMTVQGVSGSITQTAGISLTVNAAPAPTFSTSPSSGQQLTTTFSYTGTGLTPNGTIQRYYQMVGGPAVQATNTTANGSGQVYWTYVYPCSNAPGTYYNWIVDVTANWTSPQVSNVVTANPSCN